MSETRWPKAILTMLKITNMQTKLQDRRSELRDEFNCQEPWQLSTRNKRISRAAYKKYVEESVRAKLDSDWQDGMSGKTTLDRYKSFKTAKGTIEHLCDNTQGSRFLANARAGCLQTRRYRSRFENIDPTCQRCGKAEETLEHVILECDSPPEAE
ncbi:uncharacterized protein LOC108864035 [Galendromus occidentalis]|uniref:Uncharacterized protein LOC108864035 n=1 Tax=Galendromus occidentalis TaxID=34638 RepID=A0AAJ7L5G9_9ACAR|nr:uncharacterized protein LOC108864035 [Galendromus occidentalis]